MDMISRASNMFWTYKYIAGNLNFCRSKKMQIIKGRLLDKYITLLGIKID